MSVELFGWNKLRTALREYNAEAARGISDAIRVTALAVEADAIKSIQRGTKTGRIYPRGAISHQASAPGQAPATDTGELVSHIKAIIYEKEAYVGTDLDYGFHLEFGTRKIAERPWLRPAREKNIPLFKKRIKAALK